MGRSIDDNEIKNFIRCVGRQMFSKSKKLFFSCLAVLAIQAPASASPIVYQLQNGTDFPGAGFVFIEPFQTIAGILNGNHVNLDFNAGNMQLTYDATGGMSGGALISISGTALKDPSAGDEHPFTTPDGLYSLSITLGDNEVLNCVAGHCQYDLMNENLHVVNPLAAATDIMLMSMFQGYSFAVDFSGSNLEGRGWAFGMDPYHVGNMFGGDFHFVGSTVPEPATMSLLGLGLAGAGFMKRKRAAR